MSPSLPTADSVSTFIFSGGEIEGQYSYKTNICEGEHLGELCNLNHDRETGDVSDKKINVYVRLFQDMLGTLIETEAHLSDLPELDHFQRYDRLSHSLKYEAEIGSKEGLIQAINKICFVPGQVKVDTIDEEAVKMSIEERDIIDLTDAPCSLPSRILQPQEILALHLYQATPLTPLIIKTEEDRIHLDATLSAANALAGPSSIKLEDLPMADTKLMNHIKTLPEPGVILAEDESQMDLPTLLKCLRVDELHCIAKQMRVKAIQNDTHSFKRFLHAIDTNIIIRLCYDDVQDPVNIQNSYNFYTITSHFSTNYTPFWSRDSPETTA
ncbi:hypothetical protein BDR06DRAFT_1005245 [Suillus hirtellus]|nr:hypothetical protein BDR06DRAFT_1005245 [Suillus hirtellus]